MGFAAGVLGWLLAASFVFHLSFLVNLSGLPLVLDFIIDVFDASLGSVSDG